MTKLYDRKAYNQVHNKLKTNAVRSVSLFDFIEFLAYYPLTNLFTQQCGLASSPPNYDWRLCNLLLHQNAETRLQLKIAEEGKVNKKKHWAYAPSLSLSKGAWTPKVVLFLQFRLVINNVF